MEADFSLKESYELLMKLLIFPRINGPHKFLFLLFSTRDLEGNLP